MKERKTDTNRKPRTPKHAPDLNTLGGRIKALRIARGMKAEQLAKQAGLLYPAAFGETDPAKDGGKSRISKWEACKFPLGSDRRQQPPIHAITAMARVLDCEVGYLLCEFDELTRATTDICRETGLTAAAVDVVKANANTLNAMLENPMFGDVYVTLKCLISNEVKQRKQALQPKKPTTPRIVGKNAKPNDALRYAHVDETTIWKHHAKEAFSRLVDDIATRAASGEYDKAETEGSRNA